MPAFTKMYRCLSLVRKPSLLACAMAIGSQGGSAQSGPVNERPLLIGYYAGTGTGLEDQHTEQLTHLIWCFGHLQGDSMVIAREQESVIATMAGLKELNPQMKVLLSLGGWGGCATCSEVFGREEGRATFAASTLQLLQRSHADGLDLDWEYPAVQGPPGHAFSADDRRSFTLLVRELRRVLGNGYELSFAAGGTDECITQGFEWAEVMPLVDRVHIMSYDLVHGYSTKTGHHAALFSCPGQELSADHAVRLLDSLGVRRKQVVIGAAFYGRVWRDVSPQNNGLFRSGTFSHSISFSALDRTTTTENGWIWFRDDVAQAPYAYNERHRQFLTCDDTWSARAKAKYVLAQGLGGIMFWQLADDRPRNGLLDAIHSELNDP